MAALIEARVTERCLTVVVDPAAAAACVAAGVGAELSVRASN